MNETPVYGHQEDIKAKNTNMLPYAVLSSNDGLSFPPPPSPPVTQYLNITQVKVEKHSKGIVHYKGPFQHIIVGYVVDYY